MPNSILNNVCNEFTGWNIISKMFTRICLFTYSYITMKLMVNLAAYIILISTLIPTFCIYACLKSVHRQLKQAKFPKDILQSLQLYREVQLLCRMYNSIHKNILLPGEIFSAICCFSIPAFVLITRWAQLDLTAMLIFTNATNVAICLMLGCFHFAAQLNDKSQLVIHTLKRKLEKCKFSFQVRTLKMHVRILNPLRIQFMGNFFDSLTPVVIIKFSVDLLVQLILLDK